MFIIFFYRDVCGARELWFEYLSTERGGREASSMHTSGFGHMDIYIYVDRQGEIAQVCMHGWCRWWAWAPRPGLEYVYVGSGTIGLRLGRS